MVRSPSPSPSPSPSTRRSRLCVTACVVALLVAGASACGSSGAAGSAPPTSPPSGAEAAPDAGSTTASSAPAAEPVVKDVLAEDTTPPGAPGYTLTLMRYTIAPGAQLAPHVHPGVQMAEIDSGTLSYTIVSGTAQVRRAGEAAARSVSGPTSFSLAAGDSVVEPFDMVHFGANDTDAPVVISATLLTRSEDGLAVPVTTTTTPTP